MKAILQRHFLFHLLRGLAFSLIFLGCNVGAAETGTGTAAAAHTGEALLITISLGLGLALAIIVGLVSWGKKQDSLLDDTLHGKPS